MRNFIFLLFFIFISCISELVSLECRDKKSNYVKCSQTKTEYIDRSTPSIFLEESVTKHIHHIRKHHLKRKIPHRFREKRSKEDQKSDVPQWAKRPLWWKKTPPSLGSSQPWIDFESDTPYLPINALPIYPPPPQ